MNHDSRRASWLSKLEHWFLRTMSISQVPSDAFPIVESDGSPVRVWLVEPGDHDVPWPEVLDASAGTSLEFLAGEPDLYED